MVKGELLQLEPVLLGRKESGELWVTGGGLYYYVDPATEVAYPITTLRAAGFQADPFFEPLDEEGLQRLAEAVAQ